MTAPDLPGLAVLGDVDPELLHELALEGLPVRGSLAPDPFGPPLPGRRYTGLADVVDDAGGPLRAVVLPASSPLADRLPDLLTAGVPVLLPDAAPWDADLLREARGVAAEGDVPVAVLLVERHRAWTALVRSGLSGRAAPPQVTVRGWPRGAGPAAELVDLVRSWCGDVVAAAALPAELPAVALPDGAPVAWALLTARGSTVLVAHEGGPVQVRLSLPPTRLVASPAAVGWEGGEPVVPREGADPTLRAFARAVAAGTAETLETADAVAGLADVVPVARVLSALRASARTEAWSELS